MKVYFSHGKESGPWGTKIKRLAKLSEGMGCAVESVDYTDLMDPDLRVERLLEVLTKKDDSFLLVGSSMGGYVSLVASESVNATAVFLMAPALYIPSLNGRSITLVRRTSKLCTVGPTMLSHRRARLDMQRKPTAHCI